MDRGADRTFLDCVTGLLGVGCRVIAVLPAGDLLAAEAELLGAEVRILPLPDPVDPAQGDRLPLRTLLAHARGLVAGWRLLGAEKPDIVLISTRSIAVWALLARLQRRESVAYLYHLRLDSGRGAERLALALFRLCSRVLVSDEESRRSLARLVPALARRTEVLRIGVAAPMRPRPPREPLKPPLQLLCPDALLTAHASDVLLEAMALLRRTGTPARLTVFGPAAAGSSAAARLGHRADAGGLEIDVVGLAPEIWRVLDAADIVVPPSQFGPASVRAALEIVLAMRPVVAGDAPEHRELLTDYATVELIAPGDALALARAITALADGWSSTITALSSSRELALDRHHPRDFHAAIVQACRADAGSRR